MKGEETNDEIATYMSSLFSGQKMFSLSWIAVTVMASFGFLPFLRSGRAQLANCQIRKRASEPGHQIEFYSLLIEDGGGWDRLSERAGKRTASLPRRPTARPLEMATLEWD